MNKTSDFNKNSERQTLQIWSCGNCEAVHLKAGNVLLNFTRSEFAELAYSINDMYQEEFGSLEFYHLISSLGSKDEVLTSNTIS